MECLVLWKVCSSPSCSWSNIYGFYRHWYQAQRMNWNHLRSLWEFWKRWDSTVVPPTTYISSDPSFTAWLIFWLKISRTVINSRGDSGSLYLRPRFRWKTLDGAASTMTKNDDVEIHVWINYRKILSKPIRFKAQSMASHFIESKPFWKSITMHARWLVPLLLKPIVNSWARIILSLIQRPLRKHIW